MNTVKRISRFLAAFLILCFLLSGRGVTYLSNAAEKDKELDKLYIKEVKMFYADSAESAKKLCDAEGFTFCPENLMDTCNTDIQSYLGYKTTKDKGDAVTDMSLLDMKSSHFEEMTYGEYLDKHISDYADKASQAMILVNEYRRQYKAGSPNALIAYDSLNMIYVDEKLAHNNTDNLLGTYLLEKADVAFFEKYMQRGNDQILNAMLNFLGSACSDYEKDGLTWVDRSLTSNILELYGEADSAERNQYNTWYEDPARTLIREIQSLADIYTEAKDLYDKYGDTFGYEKSDGIDKDTSLAVIIGKDPNCKIPEYVNAITIHDLLAEIKYGDDGATLADYFMDLGADENLSLHPESVFPLVESMSAAQIAVLEVCGLSTLVKSIYQVEDYEKDRKELISQAVADLKEQGFKEGKIWLWEGVDQSVYALKAAETSDLIEAQHAGQAVIDSTNKAAREAASTLTLALQIIDIALMALSGITMIIQAAVGASLWAAGMACYTMAGLALSASLTGLMIGWAIAGALLCACFVISIVVLIASLAYLIYSILDWCGVFDEVPKADYTTIPNILFHARANQEGTYRVRYDAVTSNASEDHMFRLYLLSTYKDDEEIVKAIKEGEDLKKYGNFRLDRAFYDHEMREDVCDMGAFQGTYDRWMALYVSKSPACGNPIEVEEGKTIIKLQKDEYQTPAGCKAVKMIGGTQAADINSIEIRGKVGTPMYMFMIMDPNAKETAEPETTPAETKPSDQYISRVRMVHKDKRDEAVNLLKKDGFTDIIDVNLTPYEGYTFIGYQFGSRATALTDLRVSTSGIDPIVHGNASYGRSGLPDSGMTPDGMSLYATTSKDAGTPITKISVETKRLDLGSGAEPVCLFSGGNAVDFKHKWSENVEFYTGAYEDLTKKKSVQIRQDDPEKGGLYIYFWPEEQYKASSKDSKAPYVSGFSYFMAASDNTDDNRYGTHAQFMQKFAKANGFELVMDGDTPAKMMSEQAGIMNPVGSYQDKEGGAAGHDWTYDVYHYMSYGYCSNFSDMGIGAFDDLKSIRKKESQNTTMYFGVSYTYNPYRAITGIAGLLAPYTETTHSLRFGGLTTPAGTMQVSNVSIQGNPVTQAGISWGYYNYTNMSTSLYPNRDAKQKSDLSWLSGGETEILSRYLLTAGPSEGRAPIRRDDLLFDMSSKPGGHTGYVPLCDMRTPGDYDHPMNLALDTTNIGSQYLYLYMKSDAGGRVTKNEDGQSIKEEGNFNTYQKKHYVAGVFCGTGKTPEEAIANLYSKASENWAGIAAQFPDISDKPLVTEFDEIIPIDLSDQTPWYQLYCHEIGSADPSDNEWVYGNEAAYLRWKHHKIHGSPVAGDYYPCKSPDDVEIMRDYAYIGVVRTNNAQGSAVPVYAMLKYYTDETGPATLSVGNVKCRLAGGPVESKEGKYYLYYSSNSATAPFSAPITEIELSNEAFINGFNTSFSCSESDRVNNALPEYSSLRMRTDEYKYLHTKYDMADLPYVEHLYVGIGNSKKEAYADLIGTTSANAATSVNCNNNSYSDKWIAIGYRRTASEKDAIRDVFLYQGEDPPNEINVDGYTLATTKKAGKVVTTVTEASIPYKLLKHNLKKGGAEVMSLNEGSGGRGLYLYFAKKRMAYEKSADQEIYPIRNIAFGYGDISPEHASAEQLADVYGTTLHGQKIFDLEAYRDPSWEYVLGIDSEENETYKIDASVGRPMSLNKGQQMKADKRKHTSGDKRVMMYVDRGAYDTNGGTAKYTPRVNASLSRAGYYSATSKYGVLMHGN